jgi:serine phosphatase RsbU (regulator of sigma subunit)
VELYAGNQLALNHVSLPGLEGGVIALPSGGIAGGDLYALFSCGEARYARIVLADATGHGFSASGVATHIHGLLHRYSDVRDTAGLLATLNESFVPGEDPASQLRLSTVVTATFDRLSGEFSYAYAAHPHLLHWSALDAQWQPLGVGMEGLPLGAIAGVSYSQQSIRLLQGDIVLAFSDALTEVESPGGTPLTSEGFTRLANALMQGPSAPPSLSGFCQLLLRDVAHYHGSTQFQDDLTMLALRRLP